jgi:hypothetical protein
MATLANAASAESVFLEEDEKIAEFPISVKAENVRIIPVEQLFVK